MMDDDFEAAFSDFLDRREYDRAANALFSMVRIAFVAGWMAAGGNPPKPQKVYELFRADLKKQTEDDIKTELTRPDEKN